MKFLIVLITSLFLCYQSTLPMLIESDSDQSYDKGDSLTIRYFDVLTLKHFSSYSNTQYPVKQVIHSSQEKTYTLSLTSILKNIVQFHLSSSPNKICFEIEKQNGANHHVHYGDTISIKDNYKSIVIFNDTTNTRICHLPKENSFFHIGEKNLTEQPRKRISIHNKDIPIITVTNIARQKPLEGNCSSKARKQSKLFASYSGTIPMGKQETINTHGTQENKKIIDSILILDIDGALQKIKIWASSDKIQTNNVLTVMRKSPGCIVLFNETTHQELACISTSQFNLLINH